MLRKYRASINIDFTSPDAREYQRLIAALIKAGWVYVETSALILETDDLGLAWRGIELIVKQCEAAGELSALTFHVQGAASFGGKEYKAALNFADPVRDILDLPWPIPKS